MGWKGTVRSIGAAIRASERDAQRRHRELQRQQKAIEKMEALEQAALEVEIYNNHIELLLSVHKEVSQEIDWNSMINEPEPSPPLKGNVNEQRASEYYPSFLQRIFGREKRIRQKVADACAEWEKKHSEWKESTELARGILSGDKKSRLDALRKLNLFSDIAELGSGMELSIGESNIITATLSVHGNDVVPKEEKKLLSSGRLSTKTLLIGRFNELYQDYGCSCIIRVANEISTILPEEKVIVTATDSLLNTSTGHMEEVPIVSVLVPKNTLKKLNLEQIDCSDSMANFVHKMNFKKTKGFAAVEKLNPVDYV